MSVGVIINGKKENVEEGISVTKLLYSKNIRPEVVTVELNEEILEKPKYNGTILKEEDKIEFVYYMGGGGHAV
jgi:thiamine biosynthesis protein ThiS